MKVKLYKQIQFSDGYIFYEQKNGRYTDTKKEAIKLFRKFRKEKKNETIS